MSEAFEGDLIRVRIDGREPGDEYELKKYLEDSLHTNVLEEFTESHHWYPPPLVLLITKAAVPVAAYAGKKLFDWVVDLLREYMKKRPSVPEIVIYDANGDEIRIPRK